MKVLWQKMYTDRLGEYGVNFLRWYRPHHCWSLCFNFGQRKLLITGGVWPNAGT